MAKIKSIRYGKTKRGNFEGYINDDLVAFWAGNIKGLGAYSAGAEEVLEAVAEFSGIEVKGLKRSQRRG